MCKKVKGMYVGTVKSGAAAFGERNFIGEKNTMAFGSDLRTSNPNEVAVGKFNKSSAGTVFSVGNGTDEEHRKNAFEVKIEDDNATSILANGFPMPIVVCDVDDIPAPRDGLIMLYMGATSGSYTQGRFYFCSGSSWLILDTNPSASYPASVTISGENSIASEDSEDYSLTIADYTGAKNIELVEAIAEDVTPDVVLNNDGTITVTNPNVGEEDATFTLSVKVRFPNCTVVTAQKEITLSAPATE